MNGLRATRDRISSGKRLVVQYLADYAPGGAYYQDQYRDHDRGSDPGHGDGDDHHDERGVAPTAPSDHDDRGGDSGHGDDHGHDHHDGRGVAPTAPTAPKSGFRKTAPKSGTAPTAPTAPKSGFRNRALMKVALSD